MQQARVEVFGQRLHAQLRGKRVLSPEDLSLMHFSDTVDDAYDYLTGELTEHYLKK